MSRVSGAALAAVLCLVPFAAEAKDQALDLSSDASAIATTEGLGFYASKGNFSKKTGVPHRIAIAAFDIRYTFRSQIYDGTMFSDYRTFLELPDEDYQKITDALYAEFVADLTADGFEVVPVDQVTAAPSYQAMNGEEDERVNDRRAVYAPTGMKNVKMASGSSTQAQKFTGLNKDLGVDAVATVYANLGICEMAGSEKKGKGGTKLCLRAESATIPALWVNLYGGYSEAKDLKGDPMYTPKYQANPMMAKSYVVAKAGMDGGFLVWDQTVMPVTEHHLFGDAHGTDVDAFYDGAIGLFGEGTKIGLAYWHAATAKI
jgi:hypothetical protein